MPHVGSFRRSIWTLCRDGEYDKLKQLLAKASASGKAEPASEQQTPTAVFLPAFQGAAADACHTGLGEA